MTLNQNQIAIAWGRSCYHGKFVTITFNGGGRATVRPEIIEACSALERCLQAWRYVTHADECGGFNCRAKTGDPNSISNHGRGIAIDLNSRTNPYGPKVITDMPLAMVQAACGVRTNSGQQVWNNGRFWSGNKDCFTGDTMIVTADGPRAVRDLAGRVVEMLSTTEDPRSGVVESQWVKAPVESFGFDRTFEVTLRRRGARATVRTTGRHRWPVQGKNNQIRFMETKDLRGEHHRKHGERIPALRYPPMAETVLDPLAVAQGIVWGDGSVYNRHGDRTPQATVQLCGPKIELREWIEPHARYWRDTDDGQRAYGLPPSLKDIPDPDSDLSVLAGFFAGWFACDGFITSTVPPSLSSSDTRAVAWMQRVAPRLGLTITNIAIQPAGKSGFNSTKDNHQISFREIDDRLLIRAKHRDAQTRGHRWFGWTVESVRPTGVVEEVFCPTVEGRHVVALATPTVPLLTGQSMHFEIVCTPQDLATGIRASSVPSIGPAPAPPPPPPPAPDWGALRKAEAAGYLVSAGDLPAPMSGQEPAPAPNFLSVIWLERVLNLISNLHLAEDGVYGDAVAHAV